MRGTIELLKYIMREHMLPGKSFTRAFKNLAIKPFDRNHDAVACLTELTKRELSGEASSACDTRKLLSKFDELPYQELTKTVDLFLVTGEL